jgi:hypothetical protein
MRDVDRQLVELADEGESIARRYTRVRDLILVQQQYNNCTTTLHMRVDFSM